MQYAITVVIVLSYVVLALLLTRGLAEIRKYPAMTRFMSLFSIVFIASGFLMVMVANVFPEFVGLVERVNLYSLMVLKIALWIFNLHAKAKFDRREHR